MSGNHQLLSELLRPQQLGDLVLPPDINRLQRMQDTGEIMNMLFYGQPGLGKTSAARVIIRNSGRDLHETNGSSATGVGYVRDEIEKWARSSSVIVSKRICFIDEADGLSKHAQWALRSTIEKANKCRFLLTANDIGKLIPAIQSRLKCVCFDIPPDDRLEVMGRLMKRYTAKLSELGLQYDEDRLRQLVGIYYPDLRSIANQIEYEFA